MARLLELMIAAEAAASAESAITQGIVQFQTAQIMEKSQVHMPVV